MRYIYLIEKAPDGSFSACVPDLPGCTTSGETVDKLKRAIKTVVKLHIDSLREHNEVVPPPSSIADVVEAA